MFSRYYSIVAARPRALTGSPLCASAQRSFGPLESTADTQPQLQPALLRLSAMISDYFARRVLAFCSPQPQ